MSTLEDKILGEKLEYYCSSSENDSDDGEEERGNEEDFEGTSSSSIGNKSNITRNCEINPPQSKNWANSGPNTGPKGVIKDWQRFKQLEAEQREEQAIEKQRLIERLSLTCKSSAEEEAEEENELEKMLADEFLLRYTQQRMAEMMNNIEQQKKKRFGALIHLNSKENYLKAIDDEEETVTVIVHIYEDVIPSCRIMRANLEQLAAAFPMIKFCELSATIAGLSFSFKESGVPALLVYKAGQLIGNFIQLGEEFGNEFTSNDVENFFIEKGIIESSS